MRECCKCSFVCGHQAYVHCENVLVCDHHELFFPLCVGGALACDSCDLDVSNSVFIGNAAASGGGAIDFISSDGEAVIGSTLFDGNTSPFGGAVRLSNGLDGTMSFCSKWMCCWCNYTCGAL